MDGITVVVNKNNNWVKQLTMAQLQSIFKADSKVKNWSDVPGTTNFPDEPIHLYTPGVASGTFEYFTERVNQTKNRQRTDQVTQSEDDNVLVKGVEGDKDAIGYFGYGYFEQNKQALHAVRIYDPSVSVHAIHPSPKTIMNQTYPLSRPLYLYVQSTQLQKKSVIHSFVTYYLNQATSLAKQVDMVPLTNKQLAVERTKFK
jgi:phosphate transport system substrate-binding protein